MGMVRDLVTGWPKAFVPFFAWIGELRNPATLKADIIAGITVALVLVPQSMAYASLAGLPAYIGLYASFIPVIIAAVLGSSRQLATGPVAVVSLMTAAALTPLVDHMDVGSDEYLMVYMALAAALAICVGVFQLFLGLFRLGVIVDFLSHPVVVGFTNGAAIIIATSQLNKIFGVERPHAEHSYQQVWAVIMNAIQDTHFLTLLMGLVAIVIMVLIRKFAPKVPSVLTAVVITTLASYLLGYQARGGQVVGEIPVGLPAMSLPTVDVTLIGDLLMPAILISLIGFMEAISIAKAMAAQTRQRLDANQELVGQGVSNITAGLFGAYPVSGSFSRSAVNISAGAVTGFSSLVTGAVVAVTLLFLTPLLYHLPQATLAAVIMMAVANLVKIEPIKHAMKVEPHDGWVAIITFGMTLVLAPHVEFAIMVGVALSLGLYIFRSMRPNFTTLSRHPDGTWRDAKRYNLPTSDQIALVRFDGSLYFADAGYFETKILRAVAEKLELKFLIIDAEGINQIDATGEAMLSQLSDSLRNSGVEMLIARMKHTSFEPLERTGLVERIGREHFFSRIQYALEYAWNELGPDFDRQACPLYTSDPYMDREHVVPRQQA